MENITEFPSIIAQEKHIPPRKLKPIYSQQLSHHTTNLTSNKREWTRKDREKMKAGKEQRIQDDG